MNIIKGIYGDYANLDYFIRSEQDPKREHGLILILTDGKHFHVGKEQFENFINQDKGDA